ncbi:unnamed protein product [Cylicocyclus nassatus]|uniref:Tonsoku-like protein n=1 Tax=Cylicocyclus nassatus TaxID=53992 RepID=A0AA36MBF2_CYLNA|nr:unnamed protein product [Cylicocyclus nassatus]
MKKRRLEEDLRREISKTTDVEKQLDLLTDLGDLQRCNGDLESAVETYKKAAQLATALSNHLDLSFVYRALAEISAEEGERKQALEYAGLFRQTAQMCGSCSQIQLSLHVSGWIYEKLAMQQLQNTADLEEALSWCLKSIDYIKKAGHRIDCDRKAVRVAGDSARRKAGLERLCSGICANLQRRSEAEKYWNTAYAYAKRNQDSELEYQLLLARIDFSWESPLKNAQRLVNFAPSKKKGQAIMELAQVLTFAGDFLAAQNALLECLLHHKSSLMPDDADLLEARLIFLYKYFHRLDRSKDPGCSRGERRKMYELIADSLCSYGGDRKELLEHAVKYYKLMFQNSVTDREKCTAAISIAQTFMDLEAFDEAREWFEKVLELETRIGKSDAKLCQTKVLLFEAKCRQKFSSKLNLLEEFGQLNSQIPEGYPSLKAAINRAMGQFFVQKGDRSEASLYLSRADTLRDEVDVEGSEEEENEETTDELDARPNKAIMRECLELARLRNSDLEIEKDRDKEKNAHGETRLHIAARSNDTAMVEKLIAAGYDVNRRDYGGWTPISEAVSAGMRENVLALLKAGAKVDPVSTEVLNDEENSTGGGITPLMEACDKGFIDIARDLLKRGASVTKRNADGWTAVDFLRNHIVNNDDDDNSKLKELTALAVSMEDMQRKQSFPVRGCAPQLNARRNVKPFVKTSRTNTADKGDDDALNSYKRAIGSMGAQSKSKKRSRQHESALFYENDALIRSPSPEDDIVLPSDCERSPDKDRSSRADLLRTRRSPSPISICSSPSVARASSSFNPLPIDDEFLIDDLPKRRKRKSCVSSDKSPAAERRESKQRRTATQPARIRRVAVRSPSPEDIEACLQRETTFTPSPSYSYVPQTQREPVNEAASAPSQALIIATLKFEDESGEPFRPDKLVTFPRIATMAEAEERFRSELGQPARIFTTRLGDGREADSAIPLLSLGEPLTIICRLQLSDNLGNVRTAVVGEDSTKLAGLSISDKLDLSLARPEKIGQVLRTATTSRPKLKSLSLDGCDITESVLSHLGVILNDLTNLSCKYVGLNDNQLSTLCSKSFFPQLSSLNLSHNEITSGSTLSNFLENCTQLSELHCCDLDVVQGQDTLMDTISRLQNLQVLDISFNSWVKGEYVEKIINSCENLSTLILDGCNLDEISFEPTWLPNLRTLSMVGCQQIEYDSLVEWISMGSIQKLDLSGTDITLDHVRTLVASRMVCPEIAIRLVRTRSIENEPQAFVDMMLSFVTNSLSPVRFEFSANFANALRNLTAFASNFLCS